MQQRKLIFLILFLTSFYASGQQKEGANWFFDGRNHGPGLPMDPGIHLDFNVPGPVAKPFFYKYAHGIGMATISDKNGNLLFFSSLGHVASRKVVNNEYQQMPNGDVFKDSVNHTGTELIVQNPADEHEYYIFFTGYSHSQPNTFKNIYDLYVAKVDMRLNNGFGDVVPNSLQLIRKTIGYGMSALMHANNRDTWVLTQNFMGDSVQAHLVSSSGIAAPVFSRLNLLLETNVDIKSSPNSEFFVGTKNPGRTGTRTTEVFKFDRSAGTISPLYTLTMPKAGHFGISYSFSPNSSKLYVGTGGTNLGGRIYQFDLTAGNQQQIQQANTLLYGNSSWSVYDMQLGIDGKIYVARGDTILFLPRINYPDQAGAACGFQNSAVPIPDRMLSDNFPTLNQTLYRNTYKFQAQPDRDTICVGESVQLSAYGAGLDRFRWKPANGLTAPADTLANPVVSPTVTTRYFVTASNPFRTDTASFKVVVIPQVSIAISGPTVVSSQMPGVWYKVQNPQKLPVSWHVTGGTILANLTDSIQVKWTDTNSSAQVLATITGPAGCPGGSDSLEVKVAIAPQPVFFNIITPNNDTYNEAFVIENLIHYPQNELQIYNRWGRRVFQKTDYQNTWMAEKVSGGVYYYIFRANGKSWKGWVEVLK